jgi:hypothetical protein
MANITNGTVSVVVTGGVGPYQYTLLNAGNMLPVPSNAYPTFTNPVSVISNTFTFGNASDTTGNSGLQAGSYKVKIVDANGCETFSDTLVVSSSSPTPTATPVPTSPASGSGGGAGPIPTATPEPTATEVPPTATPAPEPTATEVPPTATPAPEPTATEVPPTATPVPDPTPTEVEPTATPVPDPTATEVEPTATPVPDPTATEVEPTATPVPTAEPTATPVPTAEPTATPVPTAEPTATPVPTAEPTATPVPPTATPVPTAEPTATPVPPTATPVPTAEPTATPVPTAEPTATPVPTAEPTATPVPTDVPTPTPTEGEVAVGYYFHGGNADYPYAQAADGLTAANPGDLFYNDGDNAYATGNLSTVLSWLINQGGTSTYNVETFTLDINGNIVGLGTSDIMSFNTSATAEYYYVAIPKTAADLTSSAPQRLIDGGLETRAVQKADFILNGNAWTLYRLGGNANTISRDISFSDND